MGAARRRSREGRGPFREFFLLLFSFFVGFHGPGLLRQRSVDWERRLTLLVCFFVVVQDSGGGGYEEYD